ncbi:MAG: hypothetical protein QXW00_03270 [Candidatus Woesearchaeota archaeon]
MRLWKKALKIAAVFAVGATCTFGRPEAVGMSLEEALNPSRINHSLRENYALLLSGSKEARHLTNLKNAYRCLINEGFKPENIIVISHKNPDASGRSFCAEPSILNLEDAINALYNAVDNNDELVVYLTGHGGRREGESTFQLSQYELSSRCLREYLERIGAGLSIIVSDQCYSGGFSEEFKEFPYDAIAISSVDEEHQTISKTFSKTFWEAFQDKSLDLNSDGMVSVREAYLAAEKAHKQALSNEPEKATSSYVYKGVKDAFLSEAQKP